MFYKLDTKRCLISFFNRILLYETFYTKSYLTQTQSYFTFTKYLTHNYYIDTSCSQYTYQNTHTQSEPALLYEYYYPTLLTKAKNCILKHLIKEIPPIAFQIMNG